MIFSFGMSEAKLPDISPSDVTKKAKEIMKAHASCKELTPEIAQRSLINFLENLDPIKTYFIRSDIELWLTPSQELLEQIVSEYHQSQFTVYEAILKTFHQSIERRRKIDQTLDFSNLPKNVQIKEFKNMNWADNEEALATRILRIRSLQMKAALKLNEKIRNSFVQRIQKRQLKYENSFLADSPQNQQKLFLSLILKSIVSSLDAHSVYFTPGEANQFIISVQQKLFGIGAQLRDDLNGIKVVKLVEGGPAFLGKQLKQKDLIIAVNGEPVIGLDIEDAVEMIRGEANTPVVLTVLREIPATPTQPSKEEKLDITVIRGEVVFKDWRYKSSHLPIGDEIIGYVKLNSFYQDHETSASIDLENEINKLKKEHRLAGLILDLRYNSGGLLPEAVAVAGLFISKGIVVSTKDENGKIQHLRDLDGTTAWDGPLIILVNRYSASAAEIVAQTLQEYGRAIIVGDDHTYGKGSFQTFTLSEGQEGKLPVVNPQGEYKVTRGCYYPVSGKTPQLVGVLSNIIIPGPFSESEIGERYAKYPLKNDTIKANFDDDLLDVPYLQRDKIRKLYKFGLQQKQETYLPYLEILSENSANRIKNNSNYQNFLKYIKNDESLDDEKEDFGQNDLQLEETYEVMKDLILMMKEKGLLETSNQQKEVFSLHQNLFKN